MKGHLFESRAGDVTRLIMIRHGQTLANVQGRTGTREDIPLTPLGSEQAALMAESAARRFPIGAIYASPVLRARQTAQPLCERLGLELQISEEITEYSLGVLGGMDLAELLSQDSELATSIRAWLAMGPDDPLPRPEVPEAESMESLVGRVLRFKDMVLERHAGQTVAAVTHLAPIKALFTTMAGGSMAQHSAFLADNTGLNVLDFYNRMPIIRAFNDTSHLDQPLKYGRVVIM